MDPQNPFLPKNISFISFLQYYDEKYPIHHIRCFLENNFQYPTCRENVTSSDNQFTTKNELIVVFSHIKSLIPISRKEHLFQPSIEALVSDLVYIDNQTNFSQVLFL